MTSASLLAQEPKDYSHLDVRPLAGSLGAEIFGVDLSKELSQEVFSEIHRAYLEYQVIFFRDQELTPEQHIAFARRFGELNIHPIYEPLPGYPEILPVVKEKDATDNIGDSWHSDVTYLDKPPMGSLLYAREIPPFGGDTLFADMYLAYETLSDGMKKMINGLKAVHSDAYLTAASKDRNKSRSTKLRDDIAEAAEAVHPVVRTHPETGRKLLFVNVPFTERFEGMTKEESRPLLDYLLKHAARPEFTCRFRWQIGSLAFWDNRCCHHYALNDYQGYRREMHRVTVEGDRPF